MQLPVVHMAIMNLNALLVIQNVFSPSAKLLSLVAL